VKSADRPQQCCADPYQHSTARARYTNSHTDNLPSWRRQTHRVSSARPTMMIHDSRFSVRQNAAKAPNIVRRPSRIIANVANTAPAQGAAATARPKIAQNPSASVSVSSFSSFEQPSINIADTTMKGSVGLSSALSKPVLLRVRVTASADVHFTTTISVCVVPACGSGRN
jgi:hypothetical protein